MEIETFAPEPYGAPPGISVSLPGEVEEAIEWHKWRDQLPTERHFYPNADPSYPTVIHTPGGSFRVVGHVGAGANGPIFLAVCQDSHICGKGQFVIKVLASAAVPHPLLREFAILHYIDKRSPPPKLSVEPVYVSPPVVLPDRTEKRYLVSRRGGMSVEAYAASQASGHLSLLELLHFWANTLELVGKLHSINLVHCDLHSGNVLFADPDQYPNLITGDLILIDFEQAQVSQGSCTRQDDLVTLIRMGRFDCPAVNTFLPEDHSIRHPAGTKPKDLRPHIAEALENALMEIYDCEDYIDFSASPPDYQSIHDALDMAIKLLS